MKRLSMVLVTVILLLAILSGVPAMAAEEVRNWRAQGFQVSGSVNDGFIRDLMARISRLSNGRINIEYHPGDAIFPTSEMPNALRDGIVELTNIHGGLYAGVNEAFSLFNSMPGLFFDPVAHAMWLTRGGGLELWQEMADSYGMNQHILLSGSTDGENFLWSNVPIREIADLEGLTVRFMPIFGTVLAEHGISVVNLPATEVVPALERGVIDAGEYASTSLDLSMGFADVAKYIIRPGIHQASACHAIAIRKDIWEALPDDLKEGIEDACAASYLYSYFDQRMDNVKATQTVIDQGIEVCYLSTDAQNTMNEWVREWLEAKAETNPWMKRVIDSQRAFATAYAPYSNMMYLPWPEWLTK